MNFKLTSSIVLCYLFSLNTYDVCGFQFQNEVDSLNRFEQDALIGAKTDYVESIPNFHLRKDYVCISWVSTGGGVDRFDAMTSLMINNAKAMPCDWAFFFYHMDSIERKDQLCKGIEAVGRRVIHCEESLYRSDQSAYVSQHVNEKYVHNMPALSNVDLLKPITRVPKQVMYMETIQLISNYKRVIMLDADFNFTGFNFELGMQIWSCAFERPPLIVQPLVRPLSSSQNTICWNANMLSWKGTNYTAYEIPVIEEQVPFFDSMFLEWFLKRVLRNHTLALHMKYENDWGDDLLWCRAAKYYGDYVLGYNGRYETPCGLLLQAGHATHEDTKTIKKDSGFTGGGYATLAMLRTQLFPNWFGNTSTCHKKIPDRIVSKPLDQKCVSEIPSPKVTKSSIKFYVYDPTLFLMYTRCRHPNPYCLSDIPNTKHSIDTMFMEALLKMKPTASPAEADLFIVPVLYSQSAHHSCGNRTENILQMLDVLESLGHYKRGSDVRNHFVMSDSFLWGRDEVLYKDRYTNAYEKNLIVGKFDTFEATEQFMPVGYSTKRALAYNCPKDHKDYPFIFEPPVSIDGRKYLVSYVGTHDGRGAYSYRRGFHNATAGIATQIPDDIFLHFGIGRQSMSWTAARQVMRLSTMTLSIPGDTPTTDRMFEAFETLTLIGVLSHDRERLLSVLPFPEQVPWEDLLIWVDTPLFVRSPIAALRQSLADPVKVKRSFELMTKHAPDVLYRIEGSRAAENVILAAYKKVNSPRRA